MFTCITNLKNLYFLQKNPYWLNAQGGVGGGALQADYWLQRKENLFIASEQVGGLAIWCS